MQKAGLIFFISWLLCGCSIETICEGGAPVFLAALAVVIISAIVLRGNDEIYADPKRFERSYLKHLEKYEKAKRAKDRHQVCQQYGCMNNMRRVLQENFGYTDEDIEALKNGQPSG